MSAEGLTVFRQNNVQKLDKFVGFSRRCGCVTAAGEGMLALVAYDVPPACPVQSYFCLTCTS